MTNMSDTEIFETLKKRIENLKSAARCKLLNSLMLSLTLDSKKFRKRAQEIAQMIQEEEND